MVKKKKARKTVRAKKAVKKTVRRKKVSARTKAKTKPTAVVVGKVEHFFGHILVAAFKLKYPIKIGDTLRFKGHTTDFVQRIDSMQINHQDVAKASKGEDIGMKVKDKVRVGDLITLEAAAKTLPVETAVERSSIQNLSLFRKPVSKPAVKPIFSPPPAQPKPPVSPTQIQPPPAPKKSDPYSDKKFFKF